MKTFKLLSTDPIKTIIDSYAQGALELPGEDDHLVQRSRTDLAESLMLNKRIYDIRREINCKLNISNNKWESNIIAGQDLKRENFMESEFRALILNECEQLRFQEDNYFDFITNWTFHNDKTRYDLIYTESSKNQGLLPGTVSQNEEYSACIIQDKKEVIYQGIIRAFHFSQKDSGDFTKSFIYDYEPGNWIVYLFWAVDELRKENRSLIGSEKSEETVQIEQGFDMNKNIKKEANKNG